jgi:hypothetical protein
MEKSNKRDKKYNMNIKPYTNLWDLERKTNYKIIARSKIITQKIISSNVFSKYHYIKIVELIV